MLAAWPELTSLDLARVFIEFDPTKQPALVSPPSEWVVPAGLVSLSMHVYSQGTRDLLARLVAASSTTLRHLNLDYACGTDHDTIEQTLPAAVAPVATTLTSFRFWVPGNGSAAWDFPAALLAALTHLESVETTLESVTLEALADVLRARSSPLKRLTLLERPEAGFIRAEPWDALVAFLGAVKVERVAVAPGLWGELWPWLYPDEEAEEEPDMDELGPEMNRLEGLVSGLVDGFEWLEGGEGR